MKCLCLLSDQIKKKIQYTGFINIHWDRYFCAINKFLGFGKSIDKLLGLTSNSNFMD